MLRLLHLELLKLRRTWVWPMVLGLPLVPALINLRWFTSTGFRGREWTAPLFAAELTWFLLLGPLALGLVAAQTVSLEEASGGWRLAWTAPRLRAEGLGAKILLLLLLALFMLLIMGVSVGLSSLLLSLMGRPDWSGFADDLLRGGIASLGLLGLSLWLALHFRTFLMPLGLSAAGTMLAFAFITQPQLGRWWPWSLPLLAAQSPTEQMWALVFSVVVGLVSFGCTFWEIERQEA